MNGIITVFVITLRFAWPAFLLLIAATAFGIFGEIGRPFPPLRAFLYLFIPFLVIGVWGGANWAAEEHLRAVGWRQNVLYAMALLSLAFAVAVPWVYRKSPRWWLLIPASLVGFSLSLAVAFVGSMAISNDWL